MGCVCGKVHKDRYHEEVIVRQVVKRVYLPPLWLVEFEDLKLQFPQPGLQPQVYPAHF